MRHKSQLKKVPDEAPKDLLMNFNKVYLGFSFQEIFHYNLKKFRRNEN